MYGADTTRARMSRDNNDRKKKKDGESRKGWIGKVKMFYAHVGIGLLPGSGGQERARASGDAARSCELDDARVVPRCICGCVRGVRTPVHEGERAAHVGDEEILRRRGVRADGAQRVREGDHVGGRLGARGVGGGGAAAARAGAAIGRAWARSGRARARKGC